MRPSYIFLSSSVHACLDALSRHSHSSKPSPHFEHHESPNSHTPPDMPQVVHNSVPSLEQMREKKRKRKATQYKFIPMKDYLGEETE